MSFLNEKNNIEKKHILSSWNNATNKNKNKHIPIAQMFQRSSTKPPETTPPVKNVGGVFNSTLVVFPTAFPKLGGWRVPSVQTYPLTNKNV